MAAVVHRCCQEPERCCVLGIRRLQVAGATVLLVVVAIATMQQPRCCYERPAAVLSIANGDATVDSGRCYSWQPAVLPGGCVAANGDRARRCYKRRLPELPTKVVGAATGGRLCCKQWSSELLRTSVMRPADVGDATDGRRCFNELATVLPLACSAATRR
jgi:hypothetical protein